MLTVPNRRFFPSDTLRDFLRLLDHVPVLRPLIGEVIQFLVVLDASSAQGELRWRLGSRRDTSARSSLHELIEAGVVIAVAPPWLKTEIEKYVPKIAVEFGLTEEAVRQEWVRIDTLIRYFCPRTEIVANVSCVDEKDLPYIQTREQIGADFIWTHDSHFIGTNPPDITGGFSISLRDYARATSILVGIKVGSGFAVLCGIDVLTALGKALIEGIQKMPPAVKVCLSLAIAGLILHPKSRAQLIGCLKRGLALIERAKPVIASVSRGTIREIVSTAHTANSTERVIREAIRTVEKPRVPAIVVARAVCLKAGEPLQLNEIEKRMRSTGYSSRARDFGGYLRKLFRRNSEFVETSTGIWTLRSA
jgi:hypothetical protein